MSLPSQAKVWNGGPTVFNFAGNQAFQQGADQDRNPGSAEIVVRGDLL
jgi:hypothetical protein